MEQNNFVQNPTKKQAIVVFSVWLFGITCSMLAQTNLFTKNPFKGPVFNLNFLNIISTMVMNVVVVNYIRNRRRAKNKAQL